MTAAVDQSLTLFVVILEESTPSRGSYGEISFSPDELKQFEHSHTVEEIEVLTPGDSVPRSPALHYLAMETHELISLARDLGRELKLHIEYDPSAGEPLLMVTEGGDIFSELLKFDRFLAADKSGRLRETRPAPGLNSTTVSLLNHRIRRARERGVSFG